MEFLSGESDESEIGDGDAYIASQLASDNDYMELRHMSQEHNVQINNSSEDQKIGLVSAVSMIVGLMIGSGIFASPGLVLKKIQSHDSALIVWACGGLVSLFGALAYAELGTIYQKDGGEQLYLSKIYGKLASFMFSWFSCVVGKPCGLAIITLVFAEYLGLLLGTNSLWLQRLMGSLCVIILTLLNSVSSHGGQRLQTISTALKMLALIFIFFSAVLYRIKYKPNDVIWVSMKQVDTRAWVDSFYLTLWAYEGWNNLNFITAEIRNPAQNLPLSIIISIPIVTLVYLITNVSFFITLPIETIETSNALGLRLGTQVAGGMGKIFIVFAVIISTLGSANASIYTAGRLQREAAKQGYFPHFFSNDSRKFQTPLRALCLQAFLAIIFIISGSYEFLVKLYGFVIWIFYALTVIGLVVIRYRQPERSFTRPFNAPILLVFMFLLFNFMLIVLSFITEEILKLVLSTLVIIIIGLTTQYVNCDQYRKYIRILDNRN